MLSFPQKGKLAVNQKKKTRLLKRHSAFKHGWKCNWWVCFFLWLSRISCCQFAAALGASLPSSGTCLRAEILLFFSGYTFDMNNDTELNRLCVCFVFFPTAAKMWLPPPHIKNRTSFRPPILQNQLIIKFSRNTFIMGRSTGNRASAKLPKGIHWVFQMCLGHHSFQSAFVFLTWLGMKTDSSLLPKTPPQKTSLRQSAWQGETRRPVVIFNSLTAL